MLFSAFGIDQKARPEVGIEMNLNNVFFFPLGIK
jgi:hypothetical protein